MSEWVLDEPGAISVELVLDRLESFCALGHSALNYSVDVGNVQIQAYGAGANAGSAGVPLPHGRIFIGQHDARVADLQLGMADSAVGLGHAKEFFSTEDFRVVFDGFSGVLDDQVRCN